MQLTEFLGTEKVSAVEEIVKIEKPTVSSL